MHDNDFDKNAGSGDDESNLAQRPNKEQLKRETLALKELVMQLIELPSGQFDALSLDADVREQILAARKMQRGALKRQIKYLVGLLRDTDRAQLERQLFRLTQVKRQQVQGFHEIERWRDELLDGNDKLIDEIVERYAAERQHLRQLVRNARRERDASKPPKSARQLFRYLTELKEQG
jgi:ribosome-associated protein